MTDTFDPTPATPDSSPPDIGLDPDTLGHELLRDVLNASLHKLDDIHESAIDLGKLEIDRTPMPADAASDALEAVLKTPCDTLEDALMAQALLLDTVFRSLVADTERSGPEHMSVALKAQMQFRRTLETLRKAGIRA